MAQNRSRITRFTTTLFTGQTPVVPGDPRRRVISFHLGSGTGVLYIDPAPIDGNLWSMFTVVQDPFYERLAYADWGDLVTSQWFFHNSGVPQSIVIYEAFVI